MLTCKDAARLLAQDALGASHFDRVRLRVHLLMCRFCRRYKRQLGAIGEGCRDDLTGVAEDQAALARLERSILERERGHNS